MRIVILGIPHTKTLDPATSGISDCAFTMKVWNLCRMMVAEGHEVVHIGTEGSNPPCSRNIDVMTHAEWEPVFGQRADSKLLKMTLPPDYKAKYIERVRAAIISLGWPAKTAVICVTWGGEQVVATNGLNQYAVASGIGNSNPYCQYRVYESYANLHACLAKEGNLHKPMWYHVVIPNGIDPNLFGPVTKDKKPYALFMGRIMENKGLRVAVQVCRGAKMPLKIAGPGYPAPFFDAKDDCEYLGIIGAEKRRELMREATVLFAPSYYLEPFGNVSVEAQMSGCPVLSSDWGAFTEHVINGKTGWRCRNYDIFAWALARVKDIDPFLCRKWAEANYSLDVIGRKYTEYFQMVLDKRNAGWYEPHPERATIGLGTMDFSMFGGGQ